MRTLLLVRHAPTPATRASAFPADEPLDEPGRRQAAGLAAALRGAAECVTSPALRCRQTAEAAGLEARVDGALAGCDFGSWRGRALALIDEDEPEAVRSWMLDPHASPHGGESLADVCARIAGWLDAQVARDGCLAAITHGEVVKAALVHALGMPLLSFWRIDASPLSLTELRSHDGQWTVARLNCAVT